MLIYPGLYLETAILAGTRIYESLAEFESQTHDYPGQVVYRVLDADGQVPENMHECYFLPGDAIDAAKNKTKTRIKDIPSGTYFRMLEGRMKGKVFIKLDCLHALHAEKNHITPLVIRQHPYDGQAALWESAPCVRVDRNGNEIPLHAKEKGDDVHDPD